jgi:hypothetical protein
LPKDTPAGVRHAGIIVPSGKTSTVIVHVPVKITGDGIQLTDLNPVKSPGHTVFNHLRGHGFDTVNEHGLISSQGTSKAGRAAQVLTVLNPTGSPVVTGAAIGQWATFLVHVGHEPTDEIFG